MLEVWASNIRAVMGTPGARGFRTLNGRCSSISSSRRSPPSSTTCIRATAMTVLEIEASMNGVMAVAGIDRRMLARP
jgi:hypothetical protein